MDQVKWTYDPSFRI